MSNKTSTSQTNYNYGAGVYVTVSLYIAFLLVVAFCSWYRNRNTEKSMVSHYFAGKSFGPVILSFTLFATMYSGYTVVGVPTDGYENGWQSLKWMGAILALVVTAVAIHPIIRELSVGRNYISPVDFIHDRYHSKFLRLLVAVCMIVPSWLYLTAQFTAMGISIYGLTNQNVPSWVGSCVLGIIILLYETFGGLKGVAWTDMLQGFLLILGFAMLSMVLRNEFGTLQSRIHKLPTRFLNTPTTKEIFKFFSFVHLWMCFPLYPHVLQRIFAAKDTKTVRITLTLMSFSAFLTMIPGILLGIYGASEITTAPKGFFGVMMGKILSKSVWNATVVTIVLTSSLAAIMSTADSALIAVSNVVCVDLAKGWITPSFTDKQVLMVGKVSSVVSAAIGLGISIAGLNLNKLAVLQSSVLIQCMPGFIMGLYCPDMRALPVTIGMLSGLIVLIILAFGFPEEFLYFDPGVWGLWVNWLVVIVVQLCIVKIIPEKFPLPTVSDEDLQDILKSNGHDIDGRVSTNLEKESINTWDRFGAIPLTHSVIKAYMNDIRQPIHCWPVFLIACLSLLFHVPIFITPNIRDSFSNGVPTWAVGSLSCLVIGSCSVAFLYSYWWVVRNDKTKMSTKMEKL